MQNKGMAINRGILILFCISFSSGKTIVEEHLPPLITRGKVFAWFIGNRMHTVLLFAVVFAWSSLPNLLGSSMGAVNSSCLHQSSLRENDITHWRKMSAEKMEELHMAKQDLLQKQRHQLLQNMQKSKNLVKWDSLLYTTAHFSSWISLELC